MSQPPYSGQPYPEQPPQGEPQSPWSGRPNPDVPNSAPPGYPQYGQQPDPTTPYGQQQYPPPQYGQAAQPDYNQPQSGQPAYGQPAYGQPGYGQPGYGQTGYGQPGYGQADYAAGGAPPPPPKKSKTLPIVLIAVAVFLVLCVGGGTAVYIGVRNTADDVKTAVNSPNPAPGSTTEPTTEPSAEPTKAPASAITVVEPKKLGGRPKLTDAQFAPLASELKSSLADVPGATKTVGTLYGTVEKRNIVVVAAAAAPLAEPGKEIDAAFTSAGFGGMKISGITDVSPGPLGGEARCGKATQQDLNMAICVWADNGSLGMMMFFFQSVAKVKGQFGTLRSQVEKKTT
jgi:hypothetical protein